MATATAAVTATVIDEPRAAGMTVVHRVQPLVLAAGYGTRLQQSIIDAAALHSPKPTRYCSDEGTGAPASISRSLFDHVRSLPKALVPIGGRSDGRSVLLDVWLHEFHRAAEAAATARCQHDGMQFEVLPVAIVVNHTMAPHFERWASERHLTTHWLRDGGAIDVSPPRDVTVLLIDDGSSSNDDRLGAVGDLALTIRLLAEHYGTSWKVAGSGVPHFVVVAGDTLFDVASANGISTSPIDESLSEGDHQLFDLSRFVDLLVTLNPSSIDANLLVTCYNVTSDDEVRLRGIIELAPDDAVLQHGIKAWQVSSFLEKPNLAQTSSRTAVPPLYGIPQAALPLVDRFMSEHRSRGCALATYDSPGHLIRWILDSNSSSNSGTSSTTSGAAVYATKISRRFDIGNLDQYKEALAEYGLRPVRSIPNDLNLSPSYRSIAVGRAFARAGLAGNPSDGYYGATVSFVIPNFRAEVIVHALEHAVAEEEALLVDTTIQRHRVRVFWSDTLGGHASPVPPDVSGEPWGHGAKRLVHEACRRFFALLEQTPSAAADLANLSDQQRATLDLQIGYNSDIPVQVGLAGSSAIVVATLRALASFIARPGIGGRALLQQLVPLAQQPSLALEIETTALSIVAGLQDRVIQCYEGVVYMDFERRIVSQHGRGEYERLDGTALPTFFLAYVGSGGLRSGRVHSNLRERFDRGDADVLAAMRRFAEYAQQVRSLLADAKAAPLSPLARQTLADVMDGNFDLRREILGDAVIGAECLQMVEIGRRQGMACKFTGSGGATLCLPRDPETFDEVATAAEFRRHGFSFVVVERHPTWASCCPPPTLSR